jgi:hypothetical protein
MYNIVHKNYFIYAPDLTVKDTDQADYYGDIMQTRKISRNIRNLQELYPSQLFEMRTAINELYSRRCSRGRDAGIYRE